MYQEIFHRVYRKTIEMRQKTNIDQEKRECNTYNIRNLWSHFQTLANDDSQNIHVSEKIIKYTRNNAAKFIFHNIIFQLKLIILL